jgi:hypothetical protein
VTSLKKDMRFLVEWLHRTAQSIPEDSKADLHLDLCQMAANAFNLWENDHFPIWLSRVVEGVIRDVGENQCGV